MDFTKVFCSQISKNPYQGLFKILDSLLSKIFLGFVLFYRATFSIWLGGRCRFEPSCSCYAQQALQQKPFLSAFKLILFRVCKCHPWGPFGYDPVPLRTMSEENS